MLDWDWLIGDEIVGDLLPEAYARYRRPIARGLRHFLSRLPGHDVAQILSAQEALSPGAPAEERLVALAEHCPALHKLGQILARDRRLAPEVRLHLQRLETLPPTTPIDLIRESLNRELGSLDVLGVELEPPALAEASVAVVVPFRCTRNRQRRLTERGVFKVLKPGIEERLARELGLLQEVGSLLDAGCDEFQIPPLEYRQVFDQVRDKLGMEVNLEDEQRHLDQAAETYGSEPDVLIPALLPFCSSRVTAMQLIDGHKVTEPGTLSSWDRRRLAELIVEALIAGPTWFPASRAIFHADPHAGNLLVTPDRKLAILDWSLTGTLDDYERIALSQLAIAGLCLNAEQARHSLISLAIDDRADIEELDQVIRDWLRRVRRGQFPGFSWLMGMLDDAVLRARLRPAGDLILFRKALLSLEGVLADVCSDLRIDDLLPWIFLRKLAGEWPRRFIMSPLSRKVGTHLSSCDLASLLVQLPWTPARAFLENTLELLSQTPSRLTDFDSGRQTQSRVV
jgi:ubiquinone biosynthesis protein